MHGLVALDADEELVRAARAILAIRGLRVLPSRDLPPGTRGVIRARRVRVPGFDGYDVVVETRHGSRKVWAELHAAGSEEALIASLVDFLERLVDPSPALSVAAGRRRRGRQRRLARAGVVGPR